LEEFCKDEGGRNFTLAGAFKNESPTAKRTTHFCAKTDLTCKRTREYKFWKKDDDVFDSKMWETGYKLNKIRNGILHDIINNFTNYRKYYNAIFYSSL